MSGQIGRLSRLKRRLGYLTPALAGETARDRAVASVGAMIGVALTALACRQTIGFGLHTPYVVAPIGASAVLLFVVPSSPLAQPWSIIGGNTISALVGIAVGQMMENSIVAIELGTAFAIAVMSSVRCLHPPGGAVALSAALAGQQAAQPSMLSILAPVAVNSILLVIVGLVFHRLTRHTYPHRPTAKPMNAHRTKDPPSSMRGGFQNEDVDAALADIREVFDIERDDLERVLRQIEIRALTRSQGRILCADVMSKDVVQVDEFASIEVARALLFNHGVSTLPVIDKSGHVVGSFGLRQLTSAAGYVADLMTEASTAKPNDLAFDLFARLTDGRTESVVILDANRRTLGVITQTDLLMAVARSMLMPALATPRRSAPEPADALRRHKR